MQIIEAEADDLPAIMQLQYLAYQSEAKLLDNFSIPPLTQTIESVLEEYQKGFVLKAIDTSGQLLGSVRGYIENGTFYIGKLIVHPDFQGQGIGTKLLRSIEERYPQPRYELFTSDRSEQNIRLYEKNGYVRFKMREISSGLNFVYLEKNKPISNLT